MSKEIKTTGQLRTFLAGALTDIESGELELDKAAQITKMAGQLNESFYAEIKTAKIRLDAGEKLTRLGAMEIGETLE